MACHHKSDNDNNNDIAITLLLGENTMTIQLATTRHAHNFHTLLQYILWQFWQLQQQQQGSSTLLSDWLEPPIAYIAGDAMLQLQASLRYSLFGSMEQLLHQVTLDLVAYITTNDLLLTAQALAAVHQRHCTNTSVTIPPQQYSLAQLYAVLETPDALSPLVIQVLHGVAKMDTRIGILLLRHGVPPIPDATTATTKKTNAVVNDMKDDDDEAEDIIALCRTLLHHQRQQHLPMVRPNKKRPRRRPPSLAELCLSDAVLRRYEPPNRFPIIDETNLSNDTGTSQPPPPSLATAIVLEACCYHNSLDATASFPLSNVQQKQQQQFDAWIQSAINAHGEKMATTLSDDLLHTVWAVYYTLQKLPCAHFILGKYPVYLDEKLPYCGAVACLRRNQQPEDHGLTSGIHYDEETKQCLDILQKLKQARNSTDQNHHQHFRDLLEMANNHPNGAIRYYLSGSLGDVIILTPTLLSSNEPTTELMTARILGSMVRATTTAQQNHHLRLVTFWAHEHPNFRERALAFGEVGRFAVAQLLQRTSCDAALTTQQLFRAVVIKEEETSMKAAVAPGAATIGSKTEMLFELLTVLYLTIMNDDANGQSLMDRFDEAIPLIVREMVHLENKQGLNLCACFRTYVLALQKTRLKLRKRSGQQNAVTTSGWLNILPPGCVAPKGLTISRSWQRNVDEQTRDLCLTPNLMEGIVLLLLIYATSTEMDFFMKKVLQGRISMKTLLESRLVSILKSMVLRVGQNPMERSAVASALGRVAYTMYRDSEIISWATLNGGDKALEASNKRDATALMSANFMYLLVNVAQFRWTSKSIKERTQALYSLEFALDFLTVAEASQYFPQIMATVNSALAMNLEIGQDVSLLWLAAIKVIDKYIHVCVESSVKTVGDNLTALIVSLVPVLDETGSDHDIELCQNVSIDLLTFLTAGDLGKKLAEDFRKIPFIPRSSRLDRIRSALNSLGVVVDDLATIDSQEGDQHECMSTSVASEGGIAYPSSIVPLQQTLHKRLTTLCPLLGNDNVRVRRVVLKHLTATLKENRKTFQSLVETEGGVSFKRFVTETRVQSRGIVPEIIDRLLKRCIDESDVEVRGLLASCIGEIGAIGPNKLADIDADWGASFGQVGGRYRSKPWESVDSPGFEIVSTHLVAALKAAPTAIDQHKIAFAIQQLMAILNIEMEDTSENSIETSKYQKAMAASGANRPSMNVALAEKLRDKGVYDVVEPFYFSEFQEADTSHAPRLPPFFGKSASFFEWFSNWCRHMIRCCVQVRSDKWSALFHACRTALRSSDGIKLAEYLLPTLIAYQLCFGRGRDQDSLVIEIVSVMNQDAMFQMPVADRRNAVSVLFSTFAILDGWTKKGMTSPKDRKIYFSSNEWSKSEPEKRIGALLQKIPYQQRAIAAASVGMYACSLQLFEISAREGAIETVLPSFTGPLAYYHPTTSALAGSFDATSNLVKKSLLELGDLETLTQIDDDLRRSDNSFFIARKEAIGDWQGALDEYERALQMNPNDVNLRLGNMRCSLELGHFETVLLISKGFPHAHGSDFAVEACWRLGRWETLEGLCKTSSGDDSSRSHADLPGSYQRCIGDAMLKLHKENYDNLFSSTEKAKQIVMNDLSRAARESYERAYEHVVKLQILQEIEEVSNLFMRVQPMVPAVSFEDSLNSWDKRLSLMAADGAMSVVKTRITLAHLARDRAMEARLFLLLGRRARKQGLANVAASSLGQADAVARCIESPRPIALLGNLQIEAAKLKHGLGECSTALRLVDLEVPKILHSQHLTNDASDLDEYTLSKVRSALKATKWMIDGGLKGCTEIMTRFQQIHEAAPKFNKGHFEFAKFMDSLLQSRIATLQGRVLDDQSPIDDDDENRRNQIIAGDRTCQSYIILCIKHYVETLRIDVKLHRYVYQALPRLLSLWFDFCSVKPSCVFEQIQKTVLGTSSQSQVAIDGEANTYPRLLHCDAANIVAHFTLKCKWQSRIQAVSNVSLKSDTAKLVSLLLRRVLVKYPAQAMWQIGWTRHSHDAQRRKAGNIIFQEAIKSLNTVSQRLHDLLLTSHTLFSYLANLAAKEANEGGKAYKVKPLSNEVDLLEYVPPIQAALSISLLEGDSGRSRDIFHRNIPRMRYLCPRVNVMASKAKPKKLKAFVVAPEDVAKFRLSKPDPADDQWDIGELHFLLKQEAKGDLRKDARVQDLNNVVNRLLADESDRKSLACRQRISLRTFTVTCISEDIGLIEWIPQTTALRSCIGRTINPVVDEKRGYRSGDRAINFQTDLRLAYDQAQNLFFKDGNLSAAAAAFENLLKKYPPVLFWWFVSRFEDPHAWYEARKRFIVSIAAWSAIGHVIGLGDRHSENILIDQLSGECVHVDFDCLLDKGLYLPKPEVVPFRLTQNIVDVFGPTGTDGIFAHSLGVSMNTLRKNRDTLLSVLEPFVKDPVINWKRTRPDATNRPPKEKDPVAAARQNMRVIECRLKGIYNIRNPNFLRIHRTDIPQNGQENDELAHHSLPLSVEGQVQKLIAEATKSENLVQIYYGWMPWV